MAYDLQQGEKSGINLLIDGDAHLQNFGFYASPERNLLFDLNDFDEAQINSFEFDIKRLLTSVYLLGDQQGFDADKLDELVQTDASIYRKTLRDLSRLVHWIVFISPPKSTILCSRSPALKIRRCCRNL